MRRRGDGRDKRQETRDKRRRPNRPVSTSSLPLPRITTRSYLLQLPFPALEKNCTCDRQQRERNRNCPKDAVRAHAEIVGHNVRRRYFKQPENEQVEVSRRPCIAGPVERGFKYHSETVERKAVRDYVKSARAVPENLRLLCKEPDDLIREQPEHDSDAKVESRVEFCGGPHRRLGTRGFLGTEILPNHRRGRIA